MKSFCRTRIFNNVYGQSSQNTFYIKKYLIIATTVSMDPKTQLLKTNLQQQTKRLLDQLRELEENKADLSQEEYNQIKNSTLQDLETFQASLSNLQKNPNNSMLESEIEKTKREIYEVIKSQLNKGEIVQKLTAEQVKGIRATIESLQNRYHLKTLPETEYRMMKRKAILRLQELGCKLNFEEAEWLQMDHHFGEQAQGVREDVQLQKLRQAQMQLQDKH